MDIYSYVRTLSTEDLASRIDQTMLEGSCEDAIKFAKESSKYPFRSLVGFPRLLKCFKEHWKGRLTAVANFPYGNSPLGSVEKELNEAWKEGAEEVDIVASPYIFRDDAEKYEEYVRNLVGLAKAIGFDVVKVIVEAPLLSDSELIRVARTIEEVEADYIKTSTGVLAKTSHRDVYLIKVAAPSAEVKASGGIREPIQTITYLLLGASVIGTSTGVQILRKYENIKRIG